MSQREYATMAVVALRDCYRFNVVRNFSRKRLLIIIINCCSSRTVIG